MIAVNFSKFTSYPKNVATFQAKVVAVSLVEAYYIQLSEFSQLLILWH